MIPRADIERRRIRRTQAGAIKNLRSLLEDTACLRDHFSRLGGCAEIGDKARVRHAEDCPYGMLREDIRTIDQATRPRRPKR